MTAAIDGSRSRWGSAWPDGLAFIAGLAIAWFGGWNTKDLVWSLWLSSLMVGYAMIVWNIFGPVAQQLRQSGGGTEPPLIAQSTANTAALAGGFFLLAFFTFHFGMFHFVHSVFLYAFFPVTTDGARGFPGAHVYWQVVKDYWPFVFVAAVAERLAFQRPVPLSPAENTAVTAPAMADRKAGLGVGDRMMTPYKNVIRLHLLIFFFAFASFAKREGFWIYAVVYAVYFFPWRLLKRETAAQSA